jgi:membrane-associated phospholipid phosphatase
VPGVPGVPVVRGARGLAMVRPRAALRAVGRPRVALRAVGRPRVALRALALALLFGHALALAQPAPNPAQVSPRRLSDWLLQEPAAQRAEAYALGLSWRVPAELPAQAAARSALLRDLATGAGALKADAEAMRRLAELIGMLPATGRVRVAMADARWLQANPDRDPVLAPGHTVVMPARPRTVTVVTARGTRCAVAHAPGRGAMAYVSTCSPSSSRRVDWVWVVQPDGRVQRSGVAIWNAEAQDEPAPGAWIWAPPRDGGWTEAFSAALAQFLATQGPAPDINAGLPVAGGAPRVAGATNEAIVAAAAAAAEVNTTVNAINPADDGLRSNGPRVTMGDWGSAGILQSPTARMAPEGRLSSSLSRISPYTHLNVFAQPFPWLEAGFRYTSVANRLYDATGTIAVSQSYKDKSVDFKLRLWSESALWPELSVGARDVTGTGFFSGEYLVASKRTGPFDWSAGIGWGYLGARGNIRNPLRFLGRSENRAGVVVGQGGNFSFGNYFSGPASLFGGVQYQTPWENLILKLEYDGNDYQHEPQANNQPVKSPWNFGAVYRLGSGADLNVAFERGNRLMLGLTLITQLDRLGFPKLADPPRVPVSPARPAREPDWSATAKDLGTQTQWDVRRVERRGSDVAVQFEGASAGYWQDRIDRAASVLHRDAPADVRTFTLQHAQRGLPMTEQRIDRETWVQKRFEALPPTEQRDAVIVQAPGGGGRADVNAPEPKILATGDKPRLEVKPGMDYQQILGGPDGFLLYQISVTGQAKFRFTEQTWLQGTLDLGLVNNYDKFKFTAPSNVPRVRTFVREYITSTPLQMRNLQVTHVGRLSENQYFAVYGGYLEMMYAGVGGEWLWRPHASSVAFGVDANFVQQRDFKQDLALRDYKVATGHATLYWDTGWKGVRTILSAGRYLAKDIGATVQLERTFANGVTMGGFFTRTNMSAADFGEGSFDKGLYVRIPLDALLLRSSGSTASAFYHPLLRDGGAKLNRGMSLYEETSSRGPDVLRRRPAPLPDEKVIPSDRADPERVKFDRPQAFAQVLPRADSTQQAFHGVAVTPDAKPQPVNADPSLRLTQALHAQGFRNIAVEFDASRRLSVTASNELIVERSRAAGRAARAALRHAPLNAREIRVTLLENGAPFVTYEFLDLNALAQFFDGTLERAALAPTVKVTQDWGTVGEPEPLARLDDLSPVEDKRFIDIGRPALDVTRRVAGDVLGAAGVARDTNWVQAGLMGAGLVLASSVLDTRADRWARDHAGNSFVKNFIKGGNALPWIGMGVAAMAALDGNDRGRSRAGFAALEAGAASYAAATGFKYLVGRARPDSGLGHSSFDAFSSNATNSAFPSRHAAVAWAVATPFALEYNAPWIYGLAAATSLARVGSREHWVSDAVGGSLLGYAMGYWFWQSARDASIGKPRLLVTPKSIGLGWLME